MRLKSPKLFNSLLGILAFLFFVHVLTSAAIVFFPTVSDVFKKSALLRYYSDYSVLGPFFTVKSVRSVYYLGYAYKSAQWSEIVNPVNENHQKYLSSGSYTNLKRAEFEKFLAGMVYSKEDLNDDQNKAYILEYLNKEYMRQQSIDSVRVLVFRDSYFEKKLKIDTIRNIKYLINQN